MTRRPPLIVWLAVALAGIVGPGAWPGHAGDAAALLSDLDAWHAGFGADLNNDGYCDYRDLFRLSLAWRNAASAPTPTPFPATGLRLMACQTRTAPGEELLVRVDLVNTFGRMVNPGMESGGVERTVQLSVNGSAFFLGEQPAKSVPVRIFRPDGGAAYVVDFAAESVTITATGTGLAAAPPLTLHFEPGAGAGGIPAEAEETAVTYDLLARAPIGYSRVSVPPVLRWSAAPESPAMIYTVSVQDRCGATIWTAENVTGTQRTYRGPALSSLTCYSWTVEGRTADGSATGVMPLVERFKCRFTVD